METFVIVLLFVLGLVVGSFLNATIFRLHAHKKIANDRSRCMHCNKQLDVSDLIPVLSYITLRGKCRHCTKHISAQYIIVELLTGALFVLAGTATHSVDLANPAFDRGILQLAVLALFIAYLVLVGTYDTRFGLVLNKVLVPGYFIGVVGGVLLGTGGLNMLIAFLTAAVFFGVLYFISSGQWIGAGDVKLGPLLGLMVGWPGILLALFIAVMLGAAYGVILIVTKKNALKDRLPFTGFLAAGTVITLLWGDNIINWYLTLVR